MKVELVNGKILDQDTFLIKRWNMLVSVPFDCLKWYDQIVYFIGGNHFKEPHKYDLDKELCYLYGCFFGTTTKINVCWNKDTVTFLNHTERLKKVLDRMMIKYKDKSNKKIPKIGLKIHLGVWRDVFRDDGILDLKVPEKIINGSRENALAFIDGFFEQSCFLAKLTNKRGEYYFTNNEEEAQGFFTLLSKIGYDIFIDRSTAFFSIIKKVNEQTMKIVPIKKIYSSNK